MIVILIEANYDQPEIIREVDGLIMLQMAEKRISGGSASDGRVRLLGQVPLEFVAFA